jgi:hypothetical protein
MNFIPFRGIQRAIDRRAGVLAAQCAICAPIAAKIAVMPKGIH